MEKKVCIIGGGISGLVSVKCCLDAGLSPTCYERDSLLGGLWDTKNPKAVPFCTVTNTSKEMSCLSDFPFPDGYPNFMCAEKLMDYFNSYAEHFNLLKFINLNTEVVNITYTGQNCIESNDRYWKVTIKDADNVEKEKDEFFDFIMISAGFNRTAYIPESMKEKLKNFNGKVIHSSDYRNWKRFENKRIVVCGFGNSSGDICAELSRHASKVYLSTKHGSFMLCRTVFSGYPWDAKVLRRISQYVPATVKNMMVSRLCNSNIDHTNFGLEPVPLGSGKPNIIPIINDEVGVRISTGHIVVKPEVSSVKANQLIFEDQSTADDIDCIVLCSGYKRHFSFLEKNNIFSFRYDGKSFPLYKNMLPIEHCGKIAFIGATAVQGSVFPVFEMQARYVAEVFRGAVQIPTETKMRRSINEEAERAKAIFGNELREPMRVQYIDYQDELAADMGAKPDILKLFLKDPLLAYHLFFGPSCPYQYRLVGPNCWAGARDAILTVDKRIWAPFAGKNRNNNSTGSMGNILLFTLLISALIFIISLSFH